MSADLPPRRRLPKLGRHKTKNLAYLTDPRTGKEVYFGPAGSPEAVEKHAAWVRDFLADAPPAPAPARPASRELTVARLCLLYLEHAKSYYRKRGKPTTEVNTVCQAIGRLNGRDGARRAVDYGPKDLKELRDRMADEGLARQHVNKQLHRIRRVWKWAVAEELLPPANLEALRAVPGLGKGRSAAPEEAPVEAVPLHVVEATLPFLTPRYAALVLFQLHGAMRPGEAVVCRPCDVDRTREPWEYHPHIHKTEHRDRERVVYLGPKARTALLPWLDACASPTAWVWTSQGRGPHAHKTGHVLERSYAQAIGKAVARANRQQGDGPPLPHWFPLQLRHSAATMVRAEAGLDAAQVLLGHAELTVTQVYAGKQVDLGREAAERLG